MWRKEPHKGAILVQRRVRVRHPAVLAAAAGAVLVAAVASPAFASTGHVTQARTAAATAGARPLTGGLRDGRTYVGESPEDDNLVQFRLQVTVADGAIAHADFELLVNGFPYSASTVSYIASVDINPARLAAFRRLGPRLAADSAAAATYQSELDDRTSPASLPQPAGGAALDAYTGLQSAWKDLITTRLELVQHVAEAFPGSGGVTHDWNEYLPATVQDHPGVRVPLVFSLHGGGNSILDGEGLGWAMLGGSQSFITVVPGGYGEDGPSPVQSSSVYNDTLDPALPDDASYLTALLKHEEATRPVDRGRVYISGMSNGGSMSSIMGLTRTGLFAGVGIISADGIEDGGGSGLHDAFTPGTIAAINSSLDRRLELPVAYMTAGDDPGAWGTSDKLIAADQAAIGYWKLMDDVTATPGWNYSYPWGQPLPDTRSVTRYGYTIDMSGMPSRDGGTLIELYNVKQMYHFDQPGGAELEWRFLSQFRRLPDGALVTAR